MEVSPPIQSGSNGPIAKECHRFLVAGPFKFGRQSSVVSYSLLLTLIHLAISVPVIYHEAIRFGQKAGATEN